MNCANCHLNRPRIEYRIAGVDGKVCRPCYRKNRYRTNPECRERQLEKVLQRQRAHHDEYLVYQAQYRSEHPEKWKYKPADNEKMKRRRATDPAFRIACALRSRVSSALNGTAKATSTLDLLGCSAQDLKTYLEVQFQPAMSWDNYGQWEIDHIRPCASFDLSEPEQQRLCFHYSNLQPLWKSQNRQKSDRYDG